MAGRSTPPPPSLPEGGGGDACPIDPSGPTKIYKIPVKVNYMGKNSQSFEDVWQAIREHEGDIFHTIRGLPFTYKIDKNVLFVNRTQWQISIINFQKAYSLLPLKGPGEISQIVQGPSYIWAILNDSRIMKKE